jgi:hypothetical protein
MTHRLLMLLFALAALEVVLAQPDYDEIDQPPHNYWQRPLKDRFTRLKEDLETGRIVLERRDEKAFLVSLLKTLDIPATSQMLVFSTTSLQLGLISPRNPRALYFNEDLYVGYIPGGRIEIVSLDAELGGIFYIFDIPKDERPLRIERSQRCMNCHARADTRYVPGLVVKSVVPGPGGGSLTAYRQEETGHGIPFEQRFGGWYVTGGNNLTNHWGNLVGELSPQGLATKPVEPGKLFAFDRYPVATSDILPQMVHEHQAGFVNRVLEASYRARTYLHAEQGTLTGGHEEELDRQARLLTRYLLFADEVPLPAGGVEGDAAFKNDFLRGRRVAIGDASLKDFDLRTRLFKYRCSYLIYSPVFEGMPPAMKERVYRRLGGALSVEQPEKEYAYLPEAEKQTIRAILKETLRDLPSRW